MYDKRLIKMICMLKRTAEKQKVPIAWKGIADFSKWAYANGYNEDKKYLKRIDVDKGFTPDNCYLSENKNGNSKIILEYNGKKQPLVDWCEELGLRVDVVRGRIANGWSIERAFEEPMPPKKEVDVEHPGYEGLANAIIVKAVLDYRIALKMQEGKVKIKDPFIRLGELEAFFRSEYFELLTDIDGESLMRRVRKEVLRK